MNNVLITGITGKSGKYMLREMIKNSEQLKDFNFRISVRASSDTAEIDKCDLNIEKYVGELDDLNYIDSLTDFNGENWTLVHIAGIGKSLNLVEAAVRHNVKRMILVHTTGIYSKYKAAGEQYRLIEAKINDILKRKKIGLTILRPTMIYGNLNDQNISVFIRMVDKLSLFPTVNGAKYELQPVWCGDLGKAYYEVLMHPETTIDKNYNLSGRTPILLIDIFHTIEQYLGKKNRYFSVPFGIAYPGAVMIYIITFGKKDYREKVQRLVEPRVFSHLEATKDFGYDPADFQTGVKNEIMEYIENKESQKRNGSV